MAAPDYTHFLAMSVASLLRDDWYCGVCGESRLDESAIQAHCRTSCKVEADDLEKCVHYFSGDELASLIINLKRRADEEARRFADHLTSLVGLDDFLYEADR